MDTRELAFADWQKGMKYKEIADKYGVSLSAVKSWATRDWKHRKVATKPDKKLQPVEKKLQPEKTKSQAKGGAPSGNKNAAGHGAPPRNKNSVKHGIYAAVFWDVLSEQEQEMVDNLPEDEAQHLFDEVRLLTVRERRIMQIIQMISDSPRGMLINEVFRAEKKREFASADDKELFEERQRTKIEQDKLQPGHEYRVGTTSIDAKDLLLRAHDTLTRVQSQKGRILAQINQMGVTRERFKFDQHRLDIELMKIEASQQAFESESDSSTSNFLEAMMDAAGEVWKEHGEPNDE